MSYTFAGHRLQCVLCEQQCHILKCPVNEKDLEEHRGFGQGSRCLLYCQSLQCGSGPQTGQAAAIPFQV